MLCQLCTQFFARVEPRAELRIATPAIPDGPRLARTSTRYPHLSYADVLHNCFASLQKSSGSQCSICRVACYNLDAVSFFQKHGDFSTILETISSSSGSTVLSAQLKSLDETAETPRRTLALYAGKLESEKLASTLEECGQMNNESTGSDASMRLLSYWMDECGNSHPQCTASSAEACFMPTRSLDVGTSLKQQSVRLVSSQSANFSHGTERYLALSHCWGINPEQVIRTTETNLDERMRCIRISESPQTFQDAVLVVHKSGSRYLWIDSLCIIQDSTTDWEQESSTMGKVYHEAWLTIGAGHASNATVGCFMKVDGVLHFPFEIELPMAGGGILKCLFNPTAPPKTIRREDPPLFTRCWILQEQMLARRMVIFDGEQMIWECLSMHGSNISPHAGATRFDISSQFIRSAITDHHTDIFRPRGTDTSTAWLAHVHWFYSVMDYTHREVSRESDRSIALNGIVQILQRGTRNTYLAGLWRDYFYIGLSWYIPFGKEFVHYGMELGEPAQARNSRQFDQLAPSWSWGSVTMPVVWANLHFIPPSPMCEVVDAEVQGLPQKQTGHIVIKGHTRFSYVRSIYPESFRTMPGIDASWIYEVNGDRPIKYGTMNIDPYSYFLASPTPPALISWLWPWLSFGLFPGSWHPDEVLPPQHPITFVAVAQRQRNHRFHHDNQDNDPHEILALGLRPTGAKEGEYRRVGYAAFDSCAWFGYECSDYKWQPSAGLWAWCSSWSFYGTQIASIADPSSMPERKWKCPWLHVGTGVHKHPILHDPLPDKAVYHESVTFKIDTIRII